MGDPSRQKETSELYLHAVKAKEPGGYREAAQLTNVRAKHL